MRLQSAGFIGRENANNLCCVRPCSWLFPISIKSDMRVSQSRSGDEMTIFPEMVLIVVIALPFVGSCFKILMRANNRNFEAYLYREPSR